EGHLDGEDPDQPVDHPAGDEAGARQPFEVLGPRDVLARGLGLARRSAAGRAHTGHLRLLSLSAARHAEIQRPRLDLHLERLDLLAVAAVELVEDLAVELDLDAARLRRADERRPARVALGGAHERAGPLHEAVGRADAELEAAVVRSGVREDLDAPEQLADV